GECPVSGLENDAGHRGLRHSVAKMKVENGASGRRAFRRGAARKKIYRPALLVFYLQYEIVVCALNQDGLSICIEELKEQQVWIQPQPPFEYGLRCIGPGAIGWVAVKAAVSFPHNLIFNTFFLHP